jgi:FkbM family methyltransferase
LLKGQKPVQLQEAKRFHELVKLKMVRPNYGIAIDGGAHVGSWTVEMAKVFQTVYAFEPCEEAFLMLCENVVNETSDCDIIPVQKALYSEECAVEVIAPRGRQTLTARQVKLNPNGKVEATTIDALDLKGCDFIKLDLEGCEPLALKGGRRTIKKYKPFLVVEFAAEKGFDPQCKKSQKILEQWGYMEIWRNGVDRGFKWMG